MATSSFTPATTRDTQLADYQSLHLRSKAATLRIVKNLAQPCLQLSQNNAFALCSSQCARWRVLGV
jgi:hypothetical protein